MRKTLKTVVGLQCRKSSRCEQKWFAFGNYDCVFIVSGQGPVCSADGPTVGRQPFAAGTGGNNGFDGNDKAFKKLRSTISIVEIWHGRSFVNRSSNAVTAKRRQDSEPASADFR